MMRPKFGKVESSIKINDDLSAVRTVQFQNSVATDDRLRYEERHRVASIKEAEGKVAELVRRIAEDDNMLDPAIKYVGKALLKVRGSFDVVFCYTVVANREPITRDKK